jgi:hypothetical protein
MAYSAPSTRSTGELCTASIWNADVVANEIAIYAGALSIASQATGDVIVASSATQLGRVAPGTSGNVLTSTGSAWASAVPADSGRRNILYNGAMQISQRQTSVAGIGASNGYFTVDRWDCEVTGLAGRFTMAQVSGGPLAEAGISDCLQVSCSTADTSVAAGEYFFLRQGLEGQDVQHIKKGTAAAEQLTLSFWVKGNAAATYAAALFDADNNRQISKTFAVTTSWSKITLTYPADTTGAFGDDNSNSLSVHFWLHAGTNFTSGTLETAWAGTTNANRAAGISSFLDATSRTFFLTGVQLELGPTATKYDHRTYGDEIARCQRYYQKSYTRTEFPGGDHWLGLVNGVNGVDGNQITGIQFTTNMRAAPTMREWSKVGTAATLCNTSGTDVSINVGTWGATGPMETQFRCMVGGGGLTAGTVYCYHWDADSEL